MKAIINYTLFIIAVISIVVTSGCKKKDESKITESKISDGDGNIYETVTIGTQVWLTENLKATKYNDGTSIQFVTDNTLWATLSTPAYCWYNNDGGNYKDIYGGLYNWWAVNTGKLCPTGWHVPSDGEWTTLTSTLGGENVAGAKLKETGTYSLA